MSRQTFEEVIEELGLDVKWEARGEARGRAEGEALARREFARKLIKKGWIGDEIAETTGLDAATVSALLEEAH